MTPASIRNNNPGAMKLGGSAKRFGGTHGETLKSADGLHGIAYFPTPEHGAAALFHLLDSAYTGRTLEAAITKWCGSIRAHSYLTLIEGRCEWKRSDQVTSSAIRDPQTAIPLAKAMARHEAGQDYPMSDQDWLEAHELAFSGATAPAPSPQNDVPTMRIEDRVGNVVKKAAKGTAAVVTGAGSAAVALDTPIVPPVSRGIVETVTNLRGWSQALPGDVSTLLVGGVVFAGVAFGAWLWQRARA